MENSEMKEREMLEFAVMAYVDKSWHDNDAYMRGFLSAHNPRDDDAAALRFAVKLLMRVVISKNGCSVRYGDDYENLVAVGLDEAVDALDATRLAITKAAAEIGKRMA